MSPLFQALQAKEQFKRNIITPPFPQHVKNASCNIQWLQKFHPIIPGMSPFNPFFFQELPKPRNPEIWHPQTTSDLSHYFFCWQNLSKSTKQNLDTFEIHWSYRQLKSSSQKTYPKISSRFFFSFSMFFSTTSLATSLDEASQVGKTQAKLLKQ